MPKPRNLFLIFSLLSALYLLSQFYRVSNAVIASDLIKDLKLNAFQGVFVRIEPRTATAT